MLHSLHSTLIKVSMVVFILTGCTSMSLTGMYKLSQLNPLTTDPAQIKVAIKTDKTVNVKDGDAHINFGYKSEDGTVDINDKFFVAIDRNHNAASFLFDNVKETDTVTILSLTLEDAKKLKENQSIITAHKHEGKKGVGTLGIGLNDFCLPQPLPNRDLSLDVYLQTDNQAGFFVFLTDIDIKEEAEKMKGDGHINVCHKTD